MFWVYFVIAIVIASIIGSFIKKKFQKFLSVTPTRRLTWEWTKRVFFLSLSVPLLFSAFQRWYYFHDEMSYIRSTKQLNLDYGDQIEVEAYLMNLSNVIDLFEGKGPNPDKTFIPIKKDWYSNPPPSKPSDPRFYLVLRLKNKGSKTAWGVLDYLVAGKKIRQIDIAPLPPQMEDFKYVVLQADFICRQNPPSEGSFGLYPYLETKWQRLYTSKGEKL